MMSAGPPGANGITNFTGLSGQVWASDACATSIAAQQAKTRSKVFVMAGYPSAFERGDFDFYLHARFGQDRRDHGRSRAYLAEVLAQHRPALLEISGVRQ